MTHQLHHKGGGKEGSLPSDVTVSQESDWCSEAARSNFIGRNDNVGDGRALTPHHHLGKLLPPESNPMTTFLPFDVIWWILLIQWIYKIAVLYFVFIEKRILCIEKLKNLIYY